MEKIEKKEDIEDMFFHIKNDGLFSDTLKLYKGEKEFPLGGIVGLTINISPDQPATVSIKYLLKDLDIKAKEEK